MPATGSRRGGLVYHWKHGWIPLDHFAALSKAHNSKSGAVKVMQKHGIDVPKGYSSGHKASGKPSTPARADVKSTHPVGATVKASQPGIDNQTHGKVVGHTPTGMVLVSHTGHNGKPLVGTFNPAHTHVVGSGATTHEAHPAPHTLKPGEHATVRGTDEYGQPATYTGKVMANGEVSSFAKGRTTGGQPLRSISVERQDGSRRQNVVYVPDPNRGEMKRGSAAERSAKPKASGSYHLERTLPDGTVKRDAYTHTPKDATKFAAMSLHDNGVMTKGNAQRAMAKHLENVPVGQHVEAGGYKFRLVPATPDKPTTPAASPHAARAAELRAAAAKKRAEADRIANGVGAPDRAGAMLRAKDSARMNARMDSGLRRFSEKQREAKALESKAHLAEGRAKTAAEKQAAADLGVTAAKLSPGDMIQHKGSVHMVTKVNRTTVSVPSIVGGPWEDKLSIGQVSKHVKVADMKESTLRTLMSRAKGNAALQAVYMAELKRRGPSL